MMIYNVECELYTYDYLLCIYFLCIELMCNWTVIYSCWSDILSAAHL